jgi:kumamolisin
MAQSQTPVKGSDRVPLPGARAIGAAHGEQWVEVTVKVKRKAELPDLAGRPKTKMTREELAAKYGANAEDVEKLAAQFRAMGLDVIHTDANSRIVEVGGTVSAMTALSG